MSGHPDSAGGSARSTSASSAASASPTSATTQPGLRERKKARTKAAIQSHAVRLFRERGYAATTVEQIAEAAEVSPSTVFRYFATKEDLVIGDDYDPLFAAVFERQPAELTPLQAIRGTLREILGDLSAEERELQREREQLILQVPALWAAGLGNIRRTVDMFAELAAKRVGRKPDDPAVQTFTGAVFGVMLSSMLAWVDQPDVDVVELLDESLVRLEQGLPL